MVFYHKKDNNPVLRHTITLAYRLYVYIQWCLVPKKIKTNSSKLFCELEFARRIAKLTARAHGKFYYVNKASDQFADVLYGPFANVAQKQ